MLQRLLIAFLLICTFIPLCYLTVRSIVVKAAEQRAEEILSQTEGATDVETTVNTARYFFDHFERDGFHKFPLVAKVGTYLRNERMPEFLRFPPGSIAILVSEGWCSTAARGFLYTLSKRDIHGTQWNMSSPHSAHAAVLIETSKGPMLVDPYFGAVTMKHGKPVHPREARRSDFIAISPTSDLHFYDEMAHVSMAAQGESMTLPSKLPMIKNQPLRFGEIDGSKQDVRTATSDHEMGVHWDYIGHHYDRSWMRVLKAQEPLRMEVILVSEPEEGVLRTLSPRPTVNGKTLTWDLNTGEEIISKDGNAAISWTRLSSYIDVDQIILTPKENVHERRTASSETSKSRPER